MVAAMTRPTKHPKTGIYRFRKRVPSDLLSHFGGKAEYKVSLGTRDVEEAKKKLLIEAARFEEQCASFRSGSVLRSERHASELAQSYYAGLITRYCENPSKQTEWDPNLFDHLWKTVPPGEISSTWDRVVSHQLHPARQVEKRLNATAKEVLIANGLRVDDDSLRCMAEAIGAAFQQASFTLRARPTRVCVGVEWPGWRWFQEGAEA